VRLRFIKGYTWEDIGEELHMTTSGVRKKYKRYFQKCPTIPNTNVI